MGTQSLGAGSQDRAAYNKYCTHAPLVYDSSSKHNFVVCKKMRVQLWQMFPQYYER